MDARMGNRSTGGRAASPFVIVVPFVVQICDRTSILLQGNEINHEGTKEHEGTRRPIMVWFRVRPIGSG